MADRRVRKVVGVSAAIAGGLLVASWLGGGLALRSGRLGPLAARLVRTNRPSQDAQVPSHRLEIRSEDGLVLGGTYWPGRRLDSPAILLLHGLGASRADYAANAAWFAAQGLAVLTLDLRGHGDSGNATSSFGLHESRDARAALAWLKRQQHGAPILLIGISMGGAAALLGDDGPLPVDALVLQAVFSDVRHAIRHRIAMVASALPARLLEPLLSYQSYPRFGISPSRLSPIAAIARYKGPVLVIGGEKDFCTPPWESRRLCDAAPGSKSLWIVPGVGHYGTSHLETEEYRGRILDFARASLGASV
jgi:alpha-beta hydrolase superfamily lysophospholipase